MPLPDEDLRTTEGWNRFVQRHGGLAGEPTRLGPATEGGKLTGDPIQDPFYHYELADGTTVDINAVGAIQSITEKTPRATQADQLTTINDPRTGKPIALVGQGTTVNLPKDEAPVWRDTRLIKQQDGSQTLWGFDPADNQFKQVPGAPAVAADAADKNPKTVESGGVTYERQPDGTYAPARGIPAVPTKPAAPTIGTINKQTMQWDPQSGTWITPPGAQATAGAKLGDTTPGVREGYLVQLRFDGDKWDIDPSVKPTPWSVEAQAQAEKLAGAPKEGDTRPNIAGGYNVTQTYKGGEWTTTAVGTRATPRDIQTLTPNIEAPYIVQTDEQGKPVTIDNPNYQGPKAPTTRGEIAQRVATLQQQAQAMMQKIRADPTVTGEQQGVRFNQWYDQNVTPQIEALSQQQQAVIADESRKAIEDQQKNLTAAANAIQSTAPYRVGPGYGQAISSMASALVKGTPAAGTDFSNAFTYRGPSIDRSTQEVLAARTQVAPGMDVQGLLNRNQWLPGGGPPPTGGPPAAAGPPPGAFPASATTPFRTFGPPPAGGGVNGTGQPVGPNPMLAAMQRNQVPGAPMAGGGVNGAGQPVGANPMLAAMQPGAGGVLPQAAPLALATGGGPLPYGGSMWRPRPPAPSPTPTPIPGPPAMTGAPGQLYGLNPGAGDTSQAELTGAPGQLTGLNPGTGFPQPPPVPPPYYGQVGEPSINGIGTYPQSRNPFASVIPLLPGVDYSQFQTNWAGPYLTPG